MYHTSDSRTSSSDTAFVKMIREGWKSDTMPFYYTQIAPHKTNTPDMMWAQALNVYDIPNSVMATTHDIGDYNCIHPEKKKGIGDRLAFLALTRDYGFDYIDAKTPMPVKYEYGVFYPAKAVVLRGGGWQARSIRVYKCPEVAKSVAVRYAWSRWCLSTLFNTSGIPVTPFNSTIE
jgi:sialate O-acetylesterase